MENNGTKAYWAAVCIRKKNNNPPFCKKDLYVSTENNKLNLDSNF